MTEKEQMRAKALEIAVSIIGPFSEQEKINLMRDNRTALSTLGNYAALASAIEDYISENF
jgi:hypothetical protein